MADIPSFVRAALGYEDALFNCRRSARPIIAILREAESVVAPDDDRLRCLFLTGSRAHTCCSARPAGARVLNGRRQSWRDGSTIGSRFHPARQPLPGPAADRVSSGGSRTPGRARRVNRTFALKDDDANARAHLFNVYISAELGERARMDQSVAALVELRRRPPAPAGSGSRATARRCWRSSTAISRPPKRLRNEGARTRASDPRRTGGGPLRRADVLNSPRARPARRSGAGDEAFDPENPDQTTWLPGFALIAAELGFEEPARRRLRELAETGFEMPL